MLTVTPHSEHEEKLIYYRKELKNKNCHYKKSQQGSIRKTEQEI